MSPRTDDPTTDHPTTDHPPLGRHPADRRPARRRTGGFAVAALALGIGAAAAGCGSAATASSGTGAAAPASPASTVTATETEYHIALSRTTLAPGRWTFDAHNAGSIPHALAITGPGLSSAAATQDLAPGSSADLTVTLAAGTYQVYCPVGDHRALGMETQVTVR